MGIPVLTSFKLFKAKRSSPLSTLASGTQSFLATAHRHPRRVSAAVLVLLAGSAFTAFGVAPLSSLPQGSAPVITQVNEAVEPSLLPEQLAKLDSQALSLYRNDVTRPSDTADSLLRRLGVDDAEAARVLRQDPTAATLLQGRAGKLIKVVVDNGRLRELIARSPAADGAQIDTHFTRLTIERIEQGGNTQWQVKSVQLPLQVEQQMASGTIQSSLYAAADDAKVPDGVTNQLAEIFGSDIDFRRELRKGDAFSVLYEAHLADGEPINWGNASGRVLAARFINKGKTHDAVWFQAAGSKGSYFDLSGRSKTRAFLASPLAFSRVTSGFAMRFHPILQKWRAHLGVDFGAPTGTAVRSVGDAVVSFAGQQNGYGNVVQLQHNGDRMTVYAHLSRIDVRKGQHIEQGQQIGAVGATGWATGPHLHFEFKIKGSQVDPMSIARASESLQLSPQALAQFRIMATNVATRLDRAGEWQSAGARSGPRFE
jgi:murein DD-endopeptidase MepM/ murein hydrolase activator NlpD